MSKINQLPPKQEFEAKPQDFSIEEMLMKGDSSLSEIKQTDQATSPVSQQEDDTACSTSDKECDTTCTKADVQIKTKTLLKDDDSIPSLSNPQEESKQVKDYSTSNEEEKLTLAEHEISHDKEINESETENSKYINWVEEAEELKRKGNEYFKNKDYALARAHYSRIFPYTKGLYQKEDKKDLDSIANIAAGQIDYKISPKISEKAKQLEIDANNNLAMAYMCEKNWDRVIIKATNTLAIEENSKAYYRRAKAYAMKNHYQDALKDLNEGLEKFPQDSKMFTSEIAKTKKMEKRFDQQEAIRISKAMNN